MERADRQKLEQYYTPREYANECVKFLLVRISNPLKFKYIEPSAGYGVFIDALEEQGIPRNTILALDLEPKGSGIIRQDFFKFKSDLSNFIAIGNPPFGKSCSLAIRFVKRLFKLGSPLVAFIAPKAMCVKHYALKSLSDYECIGELDMPEETHFEIDDVDYDGGHNSVRCSFQVWRKRDVGLQWQPQESFEWKDVTPSCNKRIDDEGRKREIPVSDLDYDFAVKSHGKLVGEVLPYADGKYKANVTRFIKVADGADVGTIMDKFRNTDYGKYTTASTLVFNPSVSPSEMVECYINQHG